MSTSTSSSADTPAPDGRSATEVLTWHERAAMVTGPVGTAAAAVVFAALVRDEVVTERLWWWLGLVGVSLVAMLVGFAMGPRHVLALVGHALAGLAWGLVLLLADERSSPDDLLFWMALTFQFATTAGVMSGQGADEMFGRSVVISMWVPAAAILLAFGSVYMAVAAAVFLLLINRDLMISSAVVRELVELRDAESRRAELAAEAATSDPLTGLLNRIGLERELGRATDFGAAMFIDLDRFKDINDRHGHAAGDRVLVEVAHRLRSTFRADDIVARLGGDEFLVVLAGAHDTVLLENRAAEVIRALEPPVDVGGALVLCSASIGVAEVAPGPIDADRVMRESDQAMYLAKRTGRRRAVLFGEHLGEEMAERSELSEELRRAVRNGDLEVWGQPVVRLADHTVAGVELLSRWRGADGDWVPSERFMPVAGEIGVSVAIAQGALVHAGRLFESWSADAVFGEAVIGVNVSVFDLGDRSFVDAVLDLVQRVAIAPGRLALELTDLALLPTHELARAHLDELTQVGVTVALDDFGTGYSSIGGLLELPLGSVKLDRSLTAGLGTDPRTQDAVSWIAELARTLGCPAVAVGVETAEQLALVEQFGYDYAQGDHVVAPVPLDQLAGRAGYEVLGRAGLVIAESRPAPGSQ